MSAMERTTHRPSRGSNALAFDEPQGDPQPAYHTPGPSTDPSSDDPIPLFLSELRREPDPQELAPSVAKPTNKHPDAGCGWWTGGFGVARSWSRYLIPMSRAPLCLTPMSRASLSTKQEHPWAARPGINQRINQRRRPPRKNRLCAKYCWKIRLAYQTQCRRVRSRPHVQGMKPLRRRKRSMPKHWQR